MLQPAQMSRPCHQAITEAHKLRGRGPGEVRVYGLDGNYQYSETAPWLDD